MATLKHIELLQRYLRLRNMSDRTIEVYCSIVGKFLAHHKKDPRNITSREIEEYLLRVDSPRTRNQITGCLKTFFKEIAGRPEVMNVPYAKVPERTPTYISRERFDHGMTACANPKHRLIFMLMFCHGLRVGELLDCQINWFGSQVVEGEKHYLLNVTGKGSKDRQLWMSPETMSELSRYAKAYRIDLTTGDQHLFQSPSGDKYSASAVRQLTHKYFGVHPHALRHSCATELVNKDVNQKKVQDLLGHRNGKTTEIYSHTSIKSMIGVSA